jgi:hypothetical protein
LQDNFLNELVDAMPQAVLPHIAPVEEL